MKVLVVKNYQRVSPFFIDHPDESQNPRDWIVIATDSIDSSHKVRGRRLFEKDIFWYYDWYEGRYADVVEDMILPCIQPSEAT